MNTLTQQLEQLTQNLRQRHSPIAANTVFYKEDPDYQALIRGIRKWAKSDLHCHISNSLSVEFIWMLFKEKDPGIQNQIKREAAEKAEKARIRALQENEPARAAQMHMPDSAWSSMESLRPYVTSYSDLDRIGYKGGVRDLVIRSTDDFRRGVCHVAKQVFADGVTYFELRFNPYKSPDDLKDLDDLSDEGIVEAVVNKAYGGFCEAERIFNKHKAGMVFSFNTAKKKNNPDMLIRILRILDKVRAKQPYLSERMVGIDLSGRDESGFYQYKQALHLAGELGFLRTAHFDALRMNMRGDYVKVEEAMGYIASIVDELDRIGHGLPLGPLHEDLLAQKGKLQATLEELWEKIKERNIVIECCPSTNLRSNKIEDYQNHPFHYWAKNGFRLALGIDGLWLWPSTLSEEIARLLISSPYRMTVDKMKEIAGTPI